MTKLKPFWANVKATPDQLEDIGIAKGFVEDVLSRPVRVVKDCFYDFYMVKDYKNRLWTVDKEFVERIFDSLGVDSDKNQI